MKQFMTEVTSIEDFELKSKEASIFVFSADWCPDCVFIKPFIKSVIDENKQFSFYYVNRDQDDLLPIFSDLDIYGIPSFVAFREGKEIGRFVSKRRKTKAEITEFIEGLN